MARVSGVRRPGVSVAAIVFAFAERALGRVPNPLRITALSPSLLNGFAAMEQAQQSASKAPAGLKKLGQLRVATRVGCPF